MERLTFADDAGSIDETLYAFHHAYTVRLPYVEFIFTAAHPPSPRTNASWQRGNEKTAALARFARRELVAWIGNGQAINLETYHGLIRSLRMWKEFDGKQNALGRGTKSEEALKTGLEVVRNLPKPTVHDYKA